jgi:hypothetical protein
MSWTSEITNDPEREYRLYVELLEDDQYRGASSVLIVGS